MSKMRAFAVIVACSVMFGLGGPPLGAGCLGGGVVIFNITEDAFRAQYGGKGLWLEGDFDETTDETPCDRLPGGD